jgi:ribosomal protein L11 methylase PrmA
VLDVLDRGSAGFIATDGDNDSVSITQDNTEVGGARYVRHEPGHQRVVECALVFSAEQFDHVIAAVLALGTESEEQLLEQRVRGVVDLKTGTHTISSKGMITWSGEEAGMNVTLGRKSRRPNNSTILSK